MEFSACWVKKKEITVQKGQGNNYLGGKSLKWESYAKTDAGKNNNSPLEYQSVCALSENPKGWAKTTSWKEKLPSS